MSERDPSDERDRRRSERVILRVPVIVSAKLDGKVVHYEPHTLVVNAHGGLLAVGIEIPVGQRFVLSNPKTQQAEPCEVVRAERLGHGRFAVAFEFDVPAPNFWPVAFPPSDWKPFQA